MSFSYPGIIELARRSGIPNFPGSTYRPGATVAGGGRSWHAVGYAVDFMGFSQDALASYFMQFDTLEVIHRSRKTGKVYGSDNNVPYAPGSNEALLSQHENHLHVAMSPEQVAKAMAGGKLSIGGLAGAAFKAANPLTPLDEFLNTIEAPVKWLLDAQNRQRIATFIIGVILIFIGLWRLA